jgi:hypothetical protein
MGRSAADFGGDGGGGLAFLKRSQSLEKLATRV